MKRPNRERDIMLLLLGAWVVLLLQTALDFIRHL